MEISGGMTCATGMGARLWAVEIASIILPYRIGTARLSTRPIAINAKYATTLSFSLTVFQFPPHPHVMLKAKGSLRYPQGFKKCKNLQDDQKSMGNNKRQKGAAEISALKWVGQGSFICITGQHGFVCELAKVLALQSSERGAKSSVHLLA